MNEKDLEKLKDSLSPIERKVLPHIKEPFHKIVEKSGLDEVTTIRALEFMQNKGLISFKIEKKEIIDLDANGIHYKKNHLPERQLILTLEANNMPTLEEAQKLSKLSDNEFKVSLGVLKKKAMISLLNGRISLTANKEELTKKSLEEQFIHALPLEKSNLTPEQQYAFENLKQRKNIIQVEEKRSIEINLSSIGEKLAGLKLDFDLIENVTPEVIRNWTKNKKFRRYELNANVPHISGGKKHFVNQSIEYAKRIWTDLGFKEMTGPMADSSFWVFDALFTPQDHPAREMQDTFFVKDAKSKILTDKLKGVKQSHESGISESKGWNYEWKAEIAERTVLRTHTTGLSARTLASLKPGDIPAKFFAIGKVFRNETVDWSHGFEFYQTEGIVIDPNANFLHLLGYLKEFYKKMGFEKIKFVPSFFAYTEPSVEIQVFHPEKKIWLELGGAGIFRPEVTAPLLGKPIPVLAWGQGFDRIIMDYYKIKDLRQMYSNDLKDLRTKRQWIK